METAWIMATLGVMGFLLTAAGLLVQMGRTLQSLKVVGERLDRIDAFYNAEIHKCGKRIDGLDAGLRNGVASRVAALDIRVSKIETRCEDYHLRHTPPPRALEA